MVSSRGGMKKYDLVIIGSGAGAVVMEEAMAHGLKVALVDRGPLGGTCLNLGCIPSKMILYPADRIMEIREAEKFGIRAEIKSVDFAAVMDRMRESIRQDRESMLKEIKGLPGLDYYDGEAHFTEPYTLKVQGREIRGKKILIASGARPLIPPIQGIETMDYLTNESVLELEDRPESMIIIGGGYIAAEYGHFFSAMGTDVFILQRGDRLLKDEEPEISAHLMELMRKRMEIHTGTEALEASSKNGECVIKARDGGTGKIREFKAAQVLIAAGRRSNADLLQVQRTGVDTDERGYIVVDDFLQTTKQNIWALGDVTGKTMFRHAANQEANIVFQNAIHGQKVSMDFSLVPHAVFTYPEVASVGLREKEARKVYDDADLLVGYAQYGEVARGEAMMEEESFAKAIVKHPEGTLLGFHVIGSQASILVQEAINAMATVGTILPIANAMHIHPALSEVVQATLGNLHPLADRGDP
jgi:mycothione reductase